MTNAAIGLNSYATGENSRFPELWRGCVGAWAMCLGPTGTRLFDFSGRQNWGTLTNMDAATDWVVSGGQYALDFDNSNDFITLPSVAYLQNNQPFTLSWWERVTANTNTFPARFRLISATNTFAVIRSTSGSYENIAFGEWRNVAGLRASATSLPTSVGRWFHFSIVGLVGPNSNNTTDFRVYENATSLSLLASGNFSSFAGSLNQIGWDSLDNGADCLMDDIRIYNRALTEREIRLLASKRGIAYERRSRRRVNEQAAAAALNAIYATRQTQLIGGGLL